jgi:hypothetical protein
MSRFSSITSESSATSAYFSDVGSTDEAPDFRSSSGRESCPNGFLYLMSANDVSVDRPKRASLADGLLGNYSSRDALARYLPPLSTNNIGASSGKPNATDAITFFFDSSASTPSKNFTSDKDNSSNYPYSVPEISDEFDADKFNSNPGIPFPHEENHNS